MQAEYRFLIVGAPTIKNREYVFDHLMDFLCDYDPKKVEIVVGDDYGVPAMMKSFAGDCGFDFKLFEADFEIHGKEAYKERDKEMLKYSTHLIAFWDSQHRFTSSMIERAKDHDLHVIVVVVSPEHFVGKSNGRYQSAPPKGDRVFRESGQGGSAQYQERRNPSTTTWPPDRSAISRSNGSFQKR